MSSFKPDENGPRPETQSVPGESHEDLASLFNYPALASLFDAPDGTAREEMRERLRRTSQDLERVIRQAPQDEADRASRVARAYAATLALLDSLEKIVPGPGA